MKVKVRYVGSGESALLSDKPGVPSIQFSRYGQLVEMEEDLFLGIISGKFGAKLAVMLDEPDFASLGHTPEELSKWGHIHTMPKAPAEFTAKVKEANRLLSEIHKGASQMNMEDNNNGN